MFEAERMVWLRMVGCCAEAIAFLWMQVGFFASVLRIVSFITVWAFSRPSAMGQ